MENNNRYLSFIQSDDKRNSLKNLYRNEYWGRHHFTQDELIDTERFELFDPSVFSNLVGAKELSLFKQDIFDIASNYVTEVKDVGSYGLFYSIAPLSIYISRKLEHFLVDSLLIDLIDDRIIEDVNNQINAHLRNSLLSKILVSELHYAREAGLLEGDNEEERFNFYVLNLTSRIDWIEYFFEEYPVALYKLLNTINSIIYNFIELLISFKSDKATLKETFALIDIDNLVRINLFVGDLHQKGKSVMILDFSKGDKLIYKPRPINIDNALFHFLDYLNSIGFDVNYKSIKSLVREEYSWVEFISYLPCSTIDEAQKYFTNMGSMLAVFYLLGTKDIIADNIVAHGEYPCFIDLELLVNKYLPEENIINYPSKVFSYFLDSVYRVGMLPSWTKSGGRDYDMFMGGVNSIKSQEVVQYQWDKLVSGKINEKKVKATLEHRDDNHLPEFNGKKYDIGHFYKEFINGFQNTCNSFIKYKDVIDINKIKSIFKDTKNRVILRETVAYDVIKNEAYNPKYLSDELECIFLYDSLWSSYTPNYINRDIILSEINQMANEDIPFFYTFEGCSDLYDGHNQIVRENFFETDTTTDLIVNRLKELDSNIVKEQIHIMDGMLKIYFENNQINFFDQKRYIKIFDKPILSDSKHLGHVNKLINIARDIGKDICDKMIIKNGNISWITKNRFGNNSNFSFSPINSDLYEGTSGIAIFFMYLSRYAPHEGYQEIASKILDQCKEEFYYKLKKGTFEITLKRLRNQISLSPYAYPSSALYLMDHISYINGAGSWDDDFSSSICSWIKKNLKEDTPVDFLIGLSGLIILLLNLYNRTHNKEFLNLAHQCGEVIIKKGVVNTSGSLSWTFQDSSDITNPYKTLGGFAHGTAGIMYALMKLGRLSQNENFHNAGISSLKFDREQFDPLTTSWKDGRSDTNSDSAAWCHGSAGIGLSRVLIKNIYNDDYLNEEIKIAAANIINVGLNHSHCLCHGDLGNLEILNSLLSFLPESRSYKDTIIHYLQNFVSQYENGKSFRCGTGGDLELLGAFVGKAGMGYNLLRLADWRNVPSLLCLESPLLSEEHLHLNPIFSE